MPDLAPDDARILEFERTAPRARGAKEEAIRERLGLTPIRYYQRLNVLLDDPAALRERPDLVGRLRRIREQHTR